MLSASVHRRSKVYVEREVFSVPKHDISVLHCIALHCFFVGRPATSGAHRCCIVFPLGSADQKTIDKDVPALNLKFWQRSLILKSHFVWIPNA